MAVRSIDVRADARPQSPQTELDCHRGGLAVAFPAGTSRSFADSPDEQATLALRRNGRSGRRAVPLPESRTTARRIEP